MQPRHHMSRFDRAVSRILNLIYYAFVAGTFVGVLGAVVLLYSEYSNLAQGKDLVMNVAQN